MICAPKKKTFQNDLQSDVLTLPFYIYHGCFFTGISIYLVHFTSFEFIIARDAHTMQGLLIGIWYAHNSIYSLHLTLASSPL